ncbi:MAG TPA: TIGR03790 family protein [Methylomirabilota bacterium]|nr:TIGR03790 family protein [Methylomirabilota bacterium]
MICCWRRLTAVVFFGFCALRLWAGGSGLNVVVVINQNSTNSIQLGNYYCEQRKVPPQNVLRTSWSGTNTDWTKAEFEAVVLNPLLSMLSARQLTNQVDYIVLSMDIPYRVRNPGAASVSGTNSTTSALFYGFKSDFDSPSFIPASCNLPDATTNSYAASEGIFRATPPGSALSNSFLVSMITSTSLGLAKQIVDQGVAGDGTFPSQAVMLAHSDDRLRNIRYQQYDDAIFNIRVRGNYQVQRTNVNDPINLGAILGYQNGRGSFTVSGTSFIPGAMADYLTSFGGFLLEPTDQTSVLAFLDAGAVATYGTVIEPCAYFQKFPSPQNYFYQARGFNIAECYYQSVTNPYQGVLVGEPLSAPFAAAPIAAWLSLPASPTFSGTTNLTVQAQALDAGHPVQQVDLFVDGNYAQTLTNIAPRANNIVNATINGRSMNYTVGAGETVKSVAAGLASVLNQSSNTNNTKVRAFAHGDRIELQSFDLTKVGPQVPITASSSVGSASALTTFVGVNGGAFLDSSAFGIRAYLVTNTPQLGSWLQLNVTKTNGQVVSVAVTNTVSGTMLKDFARMLFDAVNTNAQLQGAEGLTVEDVNMHEDSPYAEFVYGIDDHSGTFNVRARGAGWPQAQIRVSIAGSPPFITLPSGTNRLDQNLPDLQPRQHLYITAGATNVLATFGFNTVTQANGFHELTAVAYEGSHVRTQRRISQAAQIQNGPLSAVFTVIAGDTNSAVESDLKFSVAANTNNISKIELFSTGWALSNVVGQASAVFSVAGTNLGIGLHPFYAIVTRNDGKQYRTETKWIRLIGQESGFRVSISGPLPALSWPAAAGRQYDILGATGAGGSFQVQDSVTPSNSAGFWLETNVLAPQRFYRIRTSD